MLSDSHRATTTESARDQQRPPFDQRFFFGGALCASGAALVGYFLLGFSLAALLVAAFALATTAWVVVWRRLTMSARVVVAMRARIGVTAGVPAIIAYDISRYLLVELTNSTVRPFEAWRAFGELLGAGERAGTAALSVGFAYHLVNGLCFAAAFGVVLAHRGAIAGVVWGLILETFMVSFYPGWLGLEALNEFLSVTIFGHVVYGFVLGWLAQRMWLRTQLATRGTP